MSAMDRETQFADLLKAARRRCDVAWLAGVVPLCLCGGAGIIVYLGRAYGYLENIDTIVLIISHIALLTAGILVGAGWMLRQLDDHSADAGG
jgi:hypothetical protein